AQVPAAQPGANDAVAGCTGPCKQQACPPEDANCLEGGAPSPAKALTNADGSAAISAKEARGARQAGSAQPADAERADTRASTRKEATSRKEEGAQSSRHGKRAAQREKVDQPSGSKRKVANSTTGRRQDGNRAWRRDFASDDGMQPANSSGRWQSRDADQASNGWRDWNAEDNVPRARFAGRAEEGNRAVNWRGERAGGGRGKDGDWDGASSRRGKRSDE